MGVRNIQNGGFLGQKCHYWPFYAFFSKFVNSNHQISDYNDKIQFVLHNIMKKLWILVGYGGQKYSKWRIFRPKMPFLTILCIFLEVCEFKSSKIQMKVSKTQIWIYQSIGNWKLIKFRIKTRNLYIKRYKPLNIWKPGGNVISQKNKKCHYNNT
jgi:hypothetical protein